MAIRYFHIPVPSPPTAFYHDMLLTEHWAIIVDSSLRREPSRLLFGKGLAFFNSSYNMRFRVSTITKDIKRYQHQYRFGLLPRNAVGPEEMIWLECSGAGHVWHTVSAWEETGQKVERLLNKTALG